MPSYSERFKQFLMTSDNGGKFVVKNPRGDIVSIVHSKESAIQCTADWNSTYQETAYSWEPWDDEKSGYAQ